MREYDGERLGKEVDRFKEEGSSLIMNWGEDTGCWEVSWITGGVRFSAIGTELVLTLRECRSKAYAYYGRVGSE